MPFWRWWYSKLFSVQPMYKYFKKISNTDHILSWKSKRLCDEDIKPPATSNNSKNSGSCLKQDSITFIHGKTVHIYIAFEIDFLGL